MAKFCKCAIPEPNFDGTCKKCEKVLTWEQSAKFRNYDKNLITEAESENEAVLPKASYQPIQKILTREDHIKVGDEAARRTIKYASLFETIGKVLKVLNIVSVILLFFIGFFIPGSGWVKFGYWVAIVIIWIFSYIQTSLIRGLASYFQMKASGHLVRNWKE